MPQRKAGTLTKKEVGAPDVAGAASLVLLVVCYALAVPHFLVHPEEDAAMLLRYSVHVAQGHGIVWNVGEPPLDGATDFLFMLLVAALHRAGMGIEASAQAIGLACHWLAVLGTFLVARLLHGAARGVALLSAAFLAAGVGLRYVAVCYGTPLFALAVLAAWAATVVAADAEPALAGASARRLGWLSVVLGMVRPEGAFLGLFFLASVLVARRTDRAAVLKGFAATFVPLGLAYFLSRWGYFGHPLPNPFYRKGGDVLHWDTLEKSFRNLATLGSGFLGILVGGLLLRRTRRAALFALLPVVAFGALWVLLSDETNYFMRFRYPILPVILASWTPVWGALWDEGWPGRLRARVPEAAMWAAGLLAAAWLLRHQYRELRHVKSEPLGLYDVALMLHDYRDRGYTLVASEAGLLPLYSEWRAVDAWGLNDAWIARHGLVTDEYLDRYRPELITFHAPFSPVLPPEQSRAGERGLGRPWLRTVLVLKRYAERRGYGLVAAFGRDPYDAHYYYVRPGFPDADAITSRLRGIRYAGAPINYAPRH